MTCLPTVAPEDAQGLLERIYDSTQKQFGLIPNIRGTLSLRPEALRAYTQLSGAVSGGGPLPLVVSSSAPTSM